MMVANTTFARLRTLVHEGLPYATGWERLCRLLTEMGEGDAQLGAEYVRHHINDWPVSARVAFVHNLTAGEAALKAPWWPLVQTLKLRLSPQTNQWLWSIKREEAFASVKAVSATVERGMPSSESCEPLFRAPHLHFEQLTLDLSGSDANDLMTQLVRSEKLARLERLEVTSRSWLAPNVKLPAKLRTHPPQAPRLETLVFRNCSISPGAVEQCLCSPAFPALKALEIDKVPYAYETLYTLAMSPHLANLRSLKLFNAKATGEDSADSAGLSARQFERLSEAWASRSLRRLSLSHPVIRPELLTPTLLSRLTHLELSGSVPFFLDRLIASAPWLENLTHLTLERDRFPADMALVLTGWKVLDRLECLSLAENQLGDLRVGELLNASPWSRLRSLNLASNKISDAGVARLTRGPLPRGLRELNLSNNRITYEGARRIAEASAFSQLTRLDLTGCRLGRAGLRILRAPSSVVRDVLVF